MHRPRISGAIAHVPAPPLPGQTPLQQAIARRDVQEVQRLLRSTRLSFSTLHALLDEACRQEGCPLPIKLALLGPATLDHQRALDLAVQHKDLALAEHLLRQGAVPERHHLRQPSPDMRDLLTRARRKRNLYPPGADRSRDTDLDRALQADQLVEAVNILEREARGEPVRKAWSNAITEDRPDILRALLMLGMVDGDPGFRLEEDPAFKIKDAAVVDVMKEIPYYSPKRGTSARLNGAVNGTDCRHFVEHRQKVQAADPNLKFDDKTVKDKTAIETHVSNSDLDVQNTRNLSTEVRMEKNISFGALIARMHEAMEKPGKLQIHWSSTNHALDVGLRLKVKGGRKIYVCKVADSNANASHARARSMSPEAFEPQEIEAYIRSRFMKSYSPEENGMALMYVRPSEDVLQEHAGVAARVIDNRKLTSCIADEEIDGTAIWHLMSGGFAGDLRRLKNVLASRGLSEEQLVALLAALSPIKTPGLNVALQYGHADAIRAFGELLSLVPKAQRAGLLAAKRADGTPGLHMAFQFGHADAVDAFDELLSLVPEEEWKDLNAAKRPDGIYGLCMAYKSGHAAAIAASKKLLKRLPEALRAELIAARTPEGKPGFCFAFEKGHPEAVKAFGTLLELVPQAQQAALLGEAARMLPHVMQKGDAATVDAFSEICTNAARRLSRAQRRFVYDEIKRSQGTRLVGLWRNYSHYNNWMAKNDGSYQRFKAMKAALAA